MGKTLFIIGIILMVGGLSLASVDTRPMTSLSDTGRKTVGFSILTGFILILISGFLYLKS